MEALLRSALPADLEAMFQLDCLCFAPAFRFTRGAMARYTREPGTFTTVAESEGTLIGFLIVAVNATRQNTEAYLVTLDVDPAYRRQGIAATLMTSAEAQAAEHGASRLTLHVWDQNQAAISFYQQRQYELIGREPAYYGAGRDAFVLSRIL